MCNPSPIGWDRTPNIPDVCGLKAPGPVDVTPRTASIQSLNLCPVWIVSYRGSNGKPQVHWLCFQVRMLSSDSSIECLYITIYLYSNIYIVYSSYIINLRFCMLSHPLSDWIIEEQKTKNTPRHLALTMSQKASSDQTEWTSCRTGGICWVNDSSTRAGLVSPFHSVMAPWCFQGFHHAQIQLSQRPVYVGNRFWLVGSLPPSTGPLGCVPFFHGLQWPHSRHTRRLWLGRSSTR